MRDINDLLSALTDDQTDAAEALEAESALRQAISKAAGGAAEVALDIEGRGALYEYAVSCKEDAIEALAKMVSVSPEDTKLIINLQQQIRPYLAVSAYIRSTLEDGDEADKAIEEIYSNDEQE